MANKTITQRIQLVGGDEIKVQLTGLGQVGAAAFTRIRTAAEGVDLSNLTKGSDQFAAAGTRAGTFAANLKELQDSVGRLTDTFPQLIQAAGRFSQRIAVVGTAAVAAGVGLAAAASNVVKQADGQSDALEKQTQAQIDANNAALAGETAQINYEASARKLTQQAQQGQISWSQYAKSLQKLKTDFDESQRTANQLATAQDAVKDANERLQKQLKDRQAYQQLTDTFGGPLLTSLISFGRQVDQIRVSFIQNFGPAAAQLVDTISNVVSANSSAITAFFSQASAKITALIAQNGPQITTLLNNIGKAAAAVFDGFISAAPAVIDFFNNKIAPAVSRVVGFFNGLADVINSVFGTRLTGGSIVIVAILAQMTGSIRILMALTKTLGASWGALGGVIAAAGQVLNTLFGGGVITGNIVKLGTAVATSGGLFNTLFSIVRAGIPIFTALAAAVASTFGITFGAAIIVIGALGAALALLLTKVDWSAFLASAKQAIGDVVATLQGWLQASKDIANAVSRALGDAWSSIVKTASDTAGNVSKAWSGIQQFFSDTWDAISKGAGDLMTNIGKVFTDGFNAAIAVAQRWYDSVVGFFTDILKQAAAVASAIAGSVSGGGGSDGAQSNARGGYIRGRGTGTSDSILSWLSNGEYVIKAKAVRKFGVDFFNALNGLRMPPGFAAGGLVRGASMLLPPLPRFAAGGPVLTGAGNSGSGRPFSLHIGSDVFNGLTASEDTVDKLERYAVRKQMHSAGRKPNWYRG
jgi:tellurite resistance protein